MTERMTSCTALTCARTSAGAAMAGAGRDVGRSMIAFMVCSVEGCTKCRYQACSDGQQGGEEVEEGGLQSHPQIAPTMRRHSGQCWAVRGSSSAACSLSSSMA